MKNYVALGDFVLDIYYDATESLLGYYPGGSIWNDLLNISRLDSNAKCFCIATCGKDAAGDFIIQTLNDAGIDTSNVLQINKQTKRFNIIVNGEFTKSQLECPNCKEKIWYSTAVFPQDIPAVFHSHQEGIAIIDSLKKPVLELAKAFRNHGWLIAADIGHINHLRYMRKDNIRSLISGTFDVIQMTNRVFNFLLNKCSCANELELYGMLACRYLNITEGDNGSKFLYLNPSGNVEIVINRAVPTPVIDPTGAGDAYFSMLLQQLDSKGNFTVGIDNALYEAGIYASKRVSVIGANGIYRSATPFFRGCKTCGNIGERREKKKTPRQRIVTNTNYLLDRILRALESSASQRLQEVLKQVNGQMLMVGTGGSFAAAEFAAKCVTQYHPKAVAHACHPRDIVISGLKKIDTVMLFSYSGKTKDIQRIYELCKKENVPVYIITKRECSRNKEIYDDVSIISYSTSKSTTRERGFISMAGTLIPMCIFGDIFYKGTDKGFIAFIKDCFERRRLEFANNQGLFNSNTTKLSIDIFSGIDTSCTAIDLESKFIESGLARVVVHEKKDFSHGRFNIIEKNTPDLIIYLNNITGSYSDKLFQYLEERNNLCILKLTSDFGPIWGDLDLVIAAEFLSKHISKTLKYDMAKPDYPQDAMTLYHYSRKDLL